MSQKNTPRTWHAVVSMFALLLAIVLLAVARNSNADGVASLLVTITIGLLFFTSLYHLVLSVER